MTIFVVLWLQAVNLSTTKILLQNNNFVEPDAKYSWERGVLSLLMVKSKHQG